MIAFIDNILIGIENKKRHNKIVQEVLKRIKANNLYIKLREVCIEG